MFPPGPLVRDDPGLYRLPGDCELIAIRGLTCSYAHASMTSVGQAHGVTSSTLVTAQDAQQIARLMSALGTASRVLILARLRASSCTVSELVVAVGMEQPAVSHQLRVLRDLGLVVGVRRGRHTVYELYDPHVAWLLDEALRHIEHLREGADEPQPLSRPTPTTKESDEHAHTG